MADENVIYKRVCPRYDKIIPTLSPLPEETLEYVDRILKTGNPESLPPVVLLLSDDVLIPFDGSTRLTKSYETGIEIPAVIILPSGRYDFDFSFTGGDIETLVYEEIIGIVRGCQKRAYELGIKTWEDQLNYVKKRRNVKRI